jgi:hypothetical protein
VYTCHTIVSSNEDVLRTVGNNARHGLSKWMRVIALADPSHTLRSWRNDAKTIALCPYP